MLLSTVPDDAHGHYKASLAVKKRQRYYYFNGALKESFGNVDV